MYQWLVVSHQKSFEDPIFSDLFMVCHFSFQKPGFIQATSFDNIKNRGSEDAVDFSEWKMAYQSYDGYSVCLI